jgi:hypothetical protein
LPLPTAAIRFLECPLDLSTLLSTLNQAAQANALSSTGLSPNLPPGQRVDPQTPLPSVPLPTGLTADLPPGQRIDPRTPLTGVSLPTRLNPSPLAGLNPNLPAGPSPNLAAELRFNSLTPSTSATLSTGLSPNLRPGQRIDPRSPPAGAGSADVYHGSEVPTSPSLLAQSGVKAYVQLLNTLSATGHSEKSADLLTNTLLGASATLKSAYNQALAKLPTQLQTKDWRFSISNGSLVFAPGEDDLPAQDLADLRAAFAGSDVESAANQVANAITSMELKRNSGADLGSLAWGRFQVDETNFDQVVDLRAYLTATAPGGNYGADVANQTAPNTAIHLEIPLTLGGMYLGDLITSRPDFFKPSVPAKTDALDNIDSSADTEASAILHGRCSCGEVCFTLENTLDYAFYCHCSRCRVRTGSAFAAIGGASIDKLRVTTGNKHLLIEGECSDGYGARCSRCYTFLFAAVRSRQYVHVSLGVLAGTPARLPDHHIYVGSKAPWYQISDAFPQYDELP